MAASLTSLNWQVSSAPEETVLYSPTALDADANVSLMNRLGGFSFQSYRSSGEYTPNDKVRYAWLRHFNLRLPWRNNKYKLQNII